MSGVIKVGQLITKLNLGGAASVVYSLAANLPPERFTVEVISLRPPGTGKDAFGRYAPVYLNWRHNTNVVTQSLDLARLLRSRRYDIVHTHLALDHLAMSLLRVAKLCGRNTRWVTTIQNEFLEGCLVRMAYKVPFAVPDVVVAPSKVAYQRLQLSGFLRGREKRVVHNTVDTTYYRPPQADERVRLRTELGFRPDCVLVTAVGYFRRQKNYALLLSALRLILDRGVDNFMCLIVGDGLLRKEIEQEVRRKNLTSHMTLLGFRSDVRDILRASDIYVLSSFYEGLPLALLEAMACGLPVVTTNAGGVPEAVESGKSGIVVPGNRPYEFAEALRKVLLDSELRRAMGNEARLRIAEKFSVDRMVKEYKDIYLTAISTEA